MGAKLIGKGLQKFGDAAVGAVGCRRGLTWLAGAANQVFRQVSFRLGLIGFEVDHITAAELDGAVPEQRWNGYLLPAEGQLRYTPANR